MANALNYLSNNYFEKDNSEEDNSNDTIHYAGTDYDITYFKVLNKDDLNALENVIKQKHDEIDKMQKKAVEENWDCVKYDSEKRKIINLSNIKFLKILKGRISDSVRETTQAFRQVCMRAIADNLENEIIDNSEKADDPLYSKTFLIDDKIEKIFESAIKHEKYMEKSKNSQKDKEKNFEVYADETIKTVEKAKKISKVQKVKKAIGAAFVALFATAAATSNSSIDVQANVPDNALNEQTRDNEKSKVNYSDFFENGIDFISTTSEMDNSIYKKVSCEGFDLVNAYRYYIKNYKDRENLVNNDKYTDEQLKIMAYENTMKYVSNDAKNYCTVRNFEFMKEVLNQFKKIDEKGGVDSYNEKYELLKKLINKNYHVCDEDAFAGSDSKKQTLKKFTESLLKEGINELNLSLLMAMMYETEENILLDKLNSLNSLNSNHHNDLSSNDLKLLIHLVEDSKNKKIIEDIIYNDNIYDDNGYRNTKEKIKKTIKVFEKFPKEIIYEVADSACRLSRNNIYNMEIMEVYDSYSDEFKKVIDDFTVDYCKNDKYTKADNEFDKKISEENNQLGIKSDNTFGIKFDRKLKMHLLNSERYENLKNIISDKKKANNFLNRIYLIIRDRYKNFACCSDYESLYMGIKKIVNESPELIKDAYENNNYEQVVNKCACNIFTYQINKGKPENIVKSNNEIFVKMTNKGKNINEIAAMMLYKSNSSGEPLFKTFRNIFSKMQGNNKIQLNSNDLDMIASTIGEKSSFKDIYDCVYENMKKSKKDKYKYANTTNKISKDRIVGEDEIGYEENRNKFIEENEKSINAISDTNKKSNKDINIYYSDSNRSEDINSEDAKINYMLVLDPSKNKEFDLDWETLERMCIRDLIKNQIQDESVNDSIIDQYVEKNIEKLELNFYTLQGLYNRNSKSDVDFGILSEDEKNDLIISTIEATVIEGIKKYCGEINVECVGNLKFCISLQDKKKTYDLYDMFETLNNKGNAIYECASMIKEVCLNNLEKDFDPKIMSEINVSEETYV